MAPKINPTKQKAQTMRRQGAFLRLGALEEEDPNDNLWALQAKQLKQIGPPSQERNSTSLGQIFRKMRITFFSTCRSIANFQISGEILLHIHL